jgi:exosome complex component RRP4
MTEEKTSPNGVRKIVVPGETIFEGADYLPGEGTDKQGDAIVAMKYGLAEEFNGLVKVIPLSGIYQPRRGNVVIGKVEMVTFRGWVINIGTADNGFLPLTEVPRFVAKDRLDEVMTIGEMVVVKLWNVSKQGIDLSIKSRGLGRLDDGMIVEVNPHKVPRIIGKEGSMINLIKENTGCDITVGQNGLIWVKGDKIDDELFAKKAINFVCEKSYVSGLTEEVTKWFEENKK